MILRHATAQDLPSLLDLARAMHAEGRYSKIPFVSQKMAHVFMNGFNQPDRFTAIVAEDSGVVVGAIVGEVIEYMFGTDHLLQDLGLYVEPEYRRGALGLRLLKDFLAEGKRFGVREVVMFGTTMEDPDAVDNLFTRAGFKKVGGVYKKEMK